MMRQQSANVTFLGTGCDYGYPGREPTSVLIERGLDRILLDCCPGILRQLTTVNREPQEIQTVFISHMHPGHFLGFPSFVFGNLPKGRNETLRVIVPERAKQRTLQMLKWCLEGIAGKGIMDIPTKPFLIDIEEGLTDGFKQFKLGEDIILTTSPVEHGCDCLGCSIEFENQEMKIAYSGDTRYSENMIKLAKNATLLIHEAIFEDAAREWAHARWHTTVKEAAEIAKKADVKILALVHPHWTRYNRITIQNEFVEEAKTIFEGTVLVPNDLGKIDLLSYRTSPYLFPSECLNGESK